MPDQAIGKVSSIREPTVSRLMNASLNFCWGAAIGVLYGFFESGPSTLAAADLLGDMVLAALLFGTAAVFLGQGFLDRVWKWL